MQKIEPLIPDQYYHIYNRGINGELLFREETNYEYFLRLYDKHIAPVADTFAWCLMGNHFHLLVRIRDSTPDRALNPVRGKNQKPPHLYFSHLFNAYTQAYNKMYSRHGSLFERPFKRKCVERESYFKQLVTYIHTNPVHHGFCNHPVEYGWSSYLTCISDRPTKLERDTVLNWFGSLENFKEVHDINTAYSEIDKYLDL